MTNPEPRIARLARRIPALRLSPVTTSAVQPVSVTYHVAEGEWELLETYTVDEHVRGGTITVPKGFRFDLASIPRPFWRALAPFELSLAAPLIHDWLYRTGGGEGGYTREEADRIFLELMEREGVAWWRRRAAYLAVRLAGRHAWRGA